MACYISDGVACRSPASVGAPIMPLETLQLGGFSDIGGIRLCMQVLAILPFALLRTITISSDSEVVPAGDQSFIAHIAPLLSLSGLRHLELRLPYHTFAFIDEHLHRMGVSWPDIVDLQLCFETLDSPDYPNTRCVREVICLCPSLRTLELPVMDISDIVDNVARYDWSKSNLDCLIIDELLRDPDMPDTDIDNALRAAFPTLIPRQAPYSLE